MSRDLGIKTSKITLCLRKFIPAAGIFYGKSIVWEYKDKNIYDIGRFRTFVDCE